MVPVVSMMLASPVKGARRTDWQPAEPLVAEPVPRHKDLPPEVPDRLAARRMDWQRKDSSAQQQETPHRDSHSTAPRMGLQAVIALAPHRRPVVHRDHIAVAPALVPVVQEPLHRLAPVSLAQERLAAVGSQESTPHIVHRLQRWA